MFNDIRASFFIVSNDPADETQARLVDRYPGYRTFWDFDGTVARLYTAEDGGHFRPHRDNTTKGTAHRRYAVSVNLNEDFDGGLVSFPEYGPRGFKPPPGGALVFLCTLLHTVSPVTRGERFAFLPFLYDDAAAKIRAANNSFLEEGVAPIGPKCSQKLPLTDSTPIRWMSRNCRSR